MQFNALIEINLGVIVLVMTKDKKIRGLTTLAQNLKTIRAAKGWTQDDLAHEAGVSEGTIKKAETEKQSPTVDTLDAIAKAFGVEPWELLKPPESTDDVRTVAEPTAPYETTPTPSPKEIAALILAYGNAESSLRASIRRQLGIDQPLDFEEISRDIEKYLSQADSIQRAKRKTE